MPGNRYASIQHPRMYRALRRRGFSKEAAARISNARTPGHRVKAAQWGARAGQTIIGNLARGGDGKFTSAGNASAPTPRQQRTDARRTARQTRRDEAARARDAARAAEDQTRAQEDTYVDAGKTPKERAARRRTVTQARRQRAAAARESQRQASDAERQRRAQEDADEQGARAADAAAKPKGGGGGGGGKAKPSDDEKKAAQQRKRQETALATGRTVGLDADAVNALRMQSEGAGLATPRLDALGLTAGGEATDAGRRALAALERGDVRGYQAAVQDARTRQDRTRQASERRTATEARRTEAAARRAQAQQAREATRQATLARLRDRARAGGKLTQAQRDRLTDAGLAVETGGRWQVKGFAVYKDARGRDRWVAVSSTAYRDRDGEIVSTAALKAAVARGDATGERGPLRYWHVPGVDLGDCDYQAVAHGGRLLVESGTFRSPAYAHALKTRGAGYQVSIGFVHPVDQPGADGVFTDIAIFERSITPPGRAANPFTSITTKEGRMLPPEKDALLAELLGGRDTQEYKAVTATIATTDKAAQDQGVAFKSDDPPADPLADLRAQVADLAATVKALAEKAPPPPEIAEAVAEDAAVAVEAMAEEPMDDGGPLLTDAELDALADRVATKLAPLFEIEKKMSAAMGELKGLFAPVAQKDDARAQQIAALAADVAALKGDAPPAAQRAIGLPVPAEVAERVKSDAGAGWTGIDTFLRGFSVNGRG